MKKKQTAKDIARLFEEKIGDDNLISEIFDYLQFDCKIRAFIDPNKLDESIKNFYDLQSVDSLIQLIDLILQGKEAYFVEDKTLLAIPPEENRGKLPRFFFTVHILFLCRVPTDKTCIAI